MIKEAIQHKEKPRHIRCGFSVCSTRDAGLFPQPRWSIVKLASEYPNPVSHILDTQRKVTMPKGAYHVVYRPDEKEWAVQKEKFERASGTFETKQAAVDRAEALARTAKVEMIPHLKDGRISNPNSYGNDSRSIRDQKH